MIKPGILLIILIDDILICFSSFCAGILQKNAGMDAQDWTLQTANPGNLIPKISIQKAPPNQPWWKR
jgi:hypothetical protein